MYIAAVNSDFYLNTAEDQCKYIMPIWNSFLHNANTEHTLVLNTKFDTQPDDYLYTLFYK